MNSSKTPRSTYRADFTPRSHVSATASRMSDSRRNKLEKLKDSALGNRRSKREKLQEVLKQKLITKYGTRLKATVEAEVDRFITATMNKKLTENDLAALENKIRTSSARGSTARRSARASTARGSARVTGRASSRQGTARGNTTQRLSSSRSDRSFQAKLDEWTLLDAFEALRNEEHVKEKKKRDREEKARLKAELDLQVAAKEKAKAAQREEEVRYYDEVFAEVRNYHKEEREKALKQQMRINKMSEARDKQVAIIRKNRARAKEKQRRYEERLLRDAAKAVEAEDNRKRRAKIRALREADVLLAENERLRIERENQDRLEREEDRRLMAEYNARELKKEQDRADFYRKTADIQKKRAKQNVAGRKDEFKKQREDELRLLREIAEQEKAAAEKEKREKRERVLALQERNRILEEQVAAKRKAAMEQREKDKQYVRAAKEEAQRYADEQKRRKKAAMRKKFSYRDELDKQLQNTTLETGGVGKTQLMTPAERSLNNEKLKLINKDPQLMKTLHDRVLKKPVHDKDEDDDDDFY